MNALLLLIKIMLWNKFCRQAGFHLIPFSCKITEEKRSGKKRDFDAAWSKFDRKFKWAAHHLDQLFDVSTPPPFKCIASCIFKIWRICTRGRRFPMTSGSKSGVLQGYLDYQELSSPP